MSYYVYIHTCPNYKRYIGITTQSPKDRWGRGNRYVSNKHFYSAIQKYGWNNIAHQVIEIDTMSEMYYLEKYLISYYHSNKKEFGYNKSTGGEKSAAGFHMREESKVKLSNSRKGKKYGPMSAEHKRKLSEAHKGKKHGPMSEEIKKKISETERRTKNSKHKRSEVVVVAE